MQNVEVEVRLGFPIDSRTHEKYAILTITDWASNTRILEAKLSSDDVVEMLSSGGPKVMAELVSAERYEKVGKKYRVGNIAFPAELAPRLQREATVGMERFARKAAKEGGWEGHRWTLHNYGWSLIGYRWDDVEEEETLSHYDVQTQEVGTGKWVTVTTFTVATEDSLKRARERADDLRAIGLYARVLDTEGKLV